METKTVTLRIPADLLAGIKKGEINDFFVDALNYNAYIKKWADREIANIFTKEEINALRASLNGSLCEGAFRYAPSALLAHTEDWMLFDKMEASQFDTSGLLEKIKGLSASQTEAVYRNAEKFWNDPHEQL